MQITINNNLMFKKIRNRQDGKDTKLIFKRGKADLDGVFLVWLSYRKNSICLPIYQLIEGEQLDLRLFQNH